LRAKENAQRRYLDGARHKEKSGALQKACMKSRLRKKSDVT
jgi:hypothetical protein